MSQKITTKSKTPFYDLVSPKEHEVVGEFSAAAADLRNFNRAAGPVSRQTGHTMIERKVKIAAFEAKKAIFVDLLRSFMPDQWPKEAYDIKASISGGSMKFNIKGLGIGDMVRININDANIYQVLGYVKGLTEVSEKSLVSVKRNTTPWAKTWNLTPLDESGVALVCLIGDNKNHYRSLAPKIIAARSPQEATAIAACNFQSDFCWLKHFSIHKSLQDAYEYGHKTGRNLFSRLAKWHTLPQILSHIKNHPKMKNCFEKTYATPYRPQPSSPLFDKALKSLRTDVQYMDYLERYGTQSFNADIISTYLLDIVDEVKAIGLFDKTKKYYSIDKSKARIKRGIGDTYFTHTPNHAFILHAMKTLLHDEIMLDRSKLVILPQGNSHE